MGKVNTAKLPNPVMANACMLHTCVYSMAVLKPDITS